MAELGFILSPCGTSLLTNAADTAERKLVNQYANCKLKNDIPSEHANCLHALIKRVGKQMITADYSYAAKMSAELNAITKLYQGKPHHKNDFHQLLCTDTWLGEATANIVADWLRKEGFIVGIRRQQDLQTANLETFQSALSDLVKWCYECLPGYRHQKYKIIFNLTGGFKSVQGFLQTLGIFHADEIIYVFETGDDLLRIPKLPVTMTVEETVRQHLNTFRRLSMNLPVDDFNEIPETLLLNVGNEITLSPWGELVWTEAKKIIYADALHPSSSEKIRFSEIFEASVKKL